MNILVREIDAKMNEKAIIENKIGEKEAWVDIDARNYFHGGVGISTIKCVAGYNHHGCRNSKVNKGMTSNRCPHYDEVEGWEHVIRCEGINQMKEAYLIDLEEGTKKIKGADNEWETIRHVLDNIRKYVCNSDEDLVTIQQIIGMDLIFKG